MIEKTFTNNELEIELTSYIDNKQNVWCKGKDIAKILGYIDTDKAIRKHIDAENKKRIRFLFSDLTFEAGISKKIQALGNITSTPIK